MKIKQIILSCCLTLFVITPFSNSSDYFGVSNTENSEDNNIDPNSILNKGRKNWLIQLQKKIHELSYKVSALEQSNRILFEVFYQKILDEYVFKSQEEAIDFLSRNKKMQRPYSLHKCVVGPLIVKVNDTYEPYWSSGREEFGQCAISRSGDSAVKLFNTEGKIGFADFHQITSTSESGYLHGISIYIISPTFSILRKKREIRSEFNKFNLYNQSTIHNLESNDVWEKDYNSILITPRGMLTSQ
ncbi:MAG: hypothetical protein C0432_01630 [Candidatus Puniceispirillum sp.]|nr:hypothetical protein [Candidatus Pelagibacter sp.]MBA4282977.1 hypothetical protein [Candidatus Puniceispirillum sp.]